jgi:hypothetical protein
MKLKKPAEEIEVCDYCSRSGYLQTCIVCGGQYCLLCEGMISGCWISPRICKVCSTRKDVNLIVEKYAQKISPIIDVRTTELSRLLPKTHIDGRVSTISKAEAVISFKRERQ